MTLQISSNRYNTTTSSPSLLYLPVGGYNHLSRILYLCSILGWQTPNIITYFRYKLISLLHPVGKRAVKHRCLQEQPFRFFCFYVKTERIGWSNCRVVYLQERGFFGHSDGEFNALKKYLTNIFSYSCIVRKYIGMSGTVTGEDPIPNRKRDRENEIEGVVDKRLVSLSNLFSFKTNNHVLRYEVNKWHSW